MQDAIDNCRASEVAMEMDLGGETFRGLSNSGAWFFEP